AELVLAAQLLEQFHLRPPVQTAPRTSTAGREPVGHTERGGPTFASTGGPSFDSEASRLSPTMRQAHPAGERMFVDYAGQTVELIDGRSGEIRQAQIFVAVMGASSYTYAEASWTQTLPDWIGSHARALAFMGGVPAQAVPDNPKGAAPPANGYDPGLTRPYLDRAPHYGTAILPTRPRKPRDKAKVEVGVLVVERWTRGRRRNRRFFSLAELNQ